jgi:hypothetical protein
MCSSDTVDREPADTCDDGVQAGGQDVAEKPERDPGLDHLRDAELGAAGGQHGLRERAQAGAEHDRQDRLGQALPPEQDRQAADEDRGELEVG